MDVLGFIAGTFFAFLGFVCSLACGVWAVVTSVASGVPIDIWALVVMLAIGIPCGRWCIYLLWDANQ